MARSRKPASLATLARALDTRKQPVPATRGLGAAQRRVLNEAVRPEARPRIEAALKGKAPSPEKSRPAPPPQPPPARPARAEPTRPVVPPRAPPGVLPTVKAPESMPRAPALASMQKRPSPLPGKVPQGVPPLSAEARRRYPRAEIHVRTRLALADDPSRVFEATLPTLNLSVGGLFLESSFFLKVGTRLIVTMQLPPGKREVRVKGEVVRVESNQSGPSGFALRFTEYLDGSQVTLATHFLSPVLKEFLSQYAKEHRFDASAEYLAHTADVLAAWELKKAELGGDVWDLFAKR